MKKTLSTFLFIVLFVSLCGQSQLQYEIDISIPELRDSTLFLAYHYGDKQYIQDFLKLDSKGMEPLRNKSLPKGIYLIVLLKQLFWILASDDQFFSPPAPIPTMSIHLNLNRQVRTVLSLNTRKIGSHINGSEQSRKAAKQPGKQ